MTNQPTARAGAGVPGAARHRFRWAAAKEAVLAAGLGWVAKCLLSTPSNFARWPEFYRLPERLHLGEAALGSIGAGGAALILLGLVMQAQEHLRTAGCWLRAAGHGLGVYLYGLLGASFLVATLDSVAGGLAMVAASLCAATALSWPEQPDGR